MRRHAISLVFLAPFLAFFAGCPESGKGSGDAASIGSGVPATGKIQKKPKDPSKPTEPVTPESGFPRDVLVELYRADQLGDRSAQKKHGLIDDKGKEVPARVAEYEAALKRFAEEHPDELSKIADELETQRVTPAPSGDVQKK